LPPSARRPLLTKNLIKPDLDVFCAAASDSNEAIKEYLPQDELQSLSGDRAVNRIFDLLLENHADVLSDTAKACIQPGGRFREYMVEKVVNASRSAELLVVFNRFLGITTDIKNKATQKAALESILALPNSELNCLDGTYERIMIVTRNLSAVQSLPKQLNLGAIDKLFAKVEQRSPHLHQGNQIHRRWNANRPGFLARHFQDYRAFLIQEINDLIHNEIEPLITLLEKAVYDGKTDDIYSFLKNVSEDKASVIGLFHPYLPDSSEEKALGGNIEHSEFHQTRAYFGDPDEDTFLPARINRDQIYSNLFSRLRDYIDPVSKMALVLANPDCATGLTRGIFTAAQKNVLGFEARNLSLSRDEDFIPTARNKEVIAQLRNRLPVYLDYVGGNLSLFLECNLIDVHSLINSPTFTRDLFAHLILPRLSKSSRVERVNQSEMPTLFVDAMGLYLRAVLQGVNGNSLAKLKDEIVVQCARVGYIDLEVLDSWEHRSSRVHAARFGVVEAAKDVFLYSLGNTLPDGPIQTEMQELFDSAVQRCMRVSGDFQGMTDFIAYLSEWTNSSHYVKVVCPALENLAGRETSPALNQIICQLLDSIERRMLNDDDSSQAEQALKVMLTVVQTMGKFRAARLFSSLQEIAAGGLARNQDPQTRAYKLMKRYLLSQVDDGHLKMPFVKALWAGDAIGQFSDATRSLSAAHWKKLVIPILGHTVIFGAGRGSIGASKTHPLASIREAVVRLTPAAIENFVLQPEEQPDIKRRALESIDVWKQVLGALNRDAIGLASHQKARLVVDFIKQFSSFGRFNLGEEESRQAINQVLNSIEFKTALSALLPEIRRQSKSASVTLMQYFLDRHEAAIQNNQTDGILPEEELNRFSRLLGVAKLGNVGFAGERSRLAAAKMQNSIRPAWASPSVVAAALTGRPVEQAVEQVRLYRDQRVQQLQGRLDSSRALYDRMQRQRLN